MLYYDVLLSSFFKRKITVLIGLLFACGILIGDTALASMIGEGSNYDGWTTHRLCYCWVGYTPCDLGHFSRLIRFLMALTIVADLVKLYVTDRGQEKLLGGTENNQQQS